MTTTTKFVASKKPLVRMVTRAAAVADKKSTMPVLAHVLLTAGDGSVNVSATDLFISVMQSCEADVKEPGSVSVPASELLARLKAMPDGPVQVSVGTGCKVTVHAVGSKRRFTLFGLPATEYPKLPAVKADDAVLTLTATQLFDLIEHTYFSVSKDETRAHLNSALFEVEPGVIRMVSTDGHRLTKYEMPVDGLDAVATMLIPLKVVNELRRALKAIKKQDRPDVAVTIAQSGQVAFFTIRDLCLSAKLIDAQFPPYEAVIPKDRDGAFSVDTAALQLAIAGVAVASSKVTDGIKLDAVEGALKLSSSDAECGDGFDEVSVDYVGPDLSVGFSHKYLIDVLKAVDTEEVSLGIGGPLDPVVLRPVGGDGGFLAVVMPMRI